MQASTMAFIGALNLMTPKKTQLVDHVFIYAFGRMFDIASAKIDNGMVIANVRLGPTVEGSGAKFDDLSEILIPAAAIEGVQFFFNRANCVIAKIDPTFSAVQDHLKQLDRRNAKS